MHHCILVEIALGNFLPADDSFALGGESLLHVMGHIVLQVLLRADTILVGKAQFCNFSLTVRTVLPSDLRAFVAAYMEEFAREYVRNLIDDIVQEAIGGILARTENIVRNSPDTPYFIRTAGA